MAELPSLKANLYAQVMTECFSGLKGQNIIAQGRVSGGTIRNSALGKGEGGETVR